MTDQLDRDTVGLRIRTVSKERAFDETGTAEESSVVQQKGRYPGVC